MRKDGKKKSYLIIPSIPTPNGRLHLGHIGGPFLSADLIARERRRTGHHASIICGTDAYESYVTHQADKENRTPDEICQYYHPLIADDLTAMSIDIDTFINPLDPKWRKRFLEWHERIFTEIAAQQGTELIQEKVLWDEKKNRFLAGCWLQGDCPICYAKTESYFCEHCGAYFRPEEVTNVKQLPIKTVENLFLKVPLKINNLKLGKLYQKTMEAQRCLLRLTANNEWGLTFSDKPKSWPAHATLFSYGLIQAYFLMMGEIFDKSNNAFALDSDVTTITCFGIDNAIPFLASGFGVAAYCQQFKPFDYYLPNYFYYLDNEKFSKSKRHAIFVKDLMNNKVSSDIVRLYLASIDVRKKYGVFSRKEFIYFYNETLSWIVNDIVKLFEQAGLPKTDNSLKNTLYKLLIEQSNLLHPDSFSPAEAIKTVYEWLFLKKQNTLWLKGLALLIYPFMPNLSQTMWEHLGFEGIPNVLDLENASITKSFTYGYQKLIIEDLHAKQLSY